MLRLMVMRGPLVLVLPLLASCGGGMTAEAPTAAAQPSAVSASASRVADALCAEAAMSWGGVVAAAFSTNAEAVRAYMADPHGADKDPTAPRPGAYDFPDGWDTLSPDHQAAACYLDGPVPKGPPPAPDGTLQPASDRRFVIAAEDVPSFMVSAGPQENMPLSPLGE